MTDIKMTVGKYKRRKKIMKLSLHDQEQFLENGSIQEVVWMEELAELQQAISKGLRGKGDRENVIEETSDVIICLTQLMIKYDISDWELQEMIDYKYNRNLKRQKEKEGYIKNPTYDELKELFK